MLKKKKKYITQTKGKIPLHSTVQDTKRPSLTYEERVGRRTRWGEKLVS